MDNRLFREAMGKFATGITVVTTEYENEVHGMTVNAFMSISLEPKLIAISIDEKATMYDMLQKTNSFGVSILSEEQKDYSMIFAKQKDANKAIDFTWNDNTPVLSDSLVSLSCQTQDKMKAGDHIIFIGKVTDVDIKQGNPLLYFESQYKSIK